MHSDIFELMKVAQFGRQGRWRIRKARTQCHVRVAFIVVGDPRFHDLPQMAYRKEFGRESPMGFRRIRVHDLRHTFGRRLRAAGAQFEDRQDLLGHKSIR